MGVNKELQQFEVDSDNDNVSEFTVGTDKEIYINNSQVQAATAAVGNVLTLADAVTGRLEFGSVAGNNIYKQPTAPISPLTNDVWSDTTNGVVKYYDGVSWINLSNDKAYFHARISLAGQPLPPPSAVKVSWDTIILDTESGWQPLSNDYVIPRDGKYLITSALNTISTTSTVGTHGFTDLLYINGVAFFAISTCVYHSTGAGLVAGLRHHGVHVANLLQGDIVDIRVITQNNWTSPSITSSSVSNDFKIIEL